MSWLDLVVATPAIGVTFEPTFQTQHEIVAAVRPLLEAWRAADADVVVAAKDAFGLQVARKDGRLFDVSASGILARHVIAPRIQTVPGGLPKLADFNVRPYTRDLPALREDFDRLFATVTGTSTRTIVRVGVVAECRLDASTAPPGVTRFLKHLARPWSRGLGRQEATLLARLGETDEYREQCHHYVKLDEIDGDKNDLELKLDWQRVMTPPCPRTAKQLADGFGKLLDSALEYFEVFGSGQLGYAD